MAGRIPRAFIEDLIQRVDIVDVVDARVPLKKAGRDHKACCPFHDEKTPSFTVSADKQFYHCFGCGAHGNAIDFLIAFDHLTFVEAVEELATQHSLEVPREGGERVAAGPDRSLREAIDAAAAFFRDALRHHAEAPQAVAYLRGRGVNGEIAARFDIGYAPSGWNNLLRSVGGDTRLRDALIELGLLIRNDQGREYDRFRQRIIFPIRDRRGRVAGFGGRALDDQGPKYLNSPESALFHKGRELYGLHEALQASGRPERLVVVEGYMDVVALAQHGIAGAVATLGTATTPEHLETLYRHTRDVIFCFDGDRAGRQAAWRALETALPALHSGRQARFLFVPEGEDPDSLVRREGTAALEARLAQAQPLSAFLFQTLAAQTDAASPEGRARLVELARPLLNRIPAGALRDLMVDETARHARLQPAQVARLLERPDQPVPSRPVPPTRRGPEAPSTVRTAIRALLHNPGLTAGRPANPAWRRLDLPGVPLLLDLLELAGENPHLTTGGILEHWREKPEGPHLARLASRELALDEAGLAREFSDALLRLDELCQRRDVDMWESTDRPSALTEVQKDEARRRFRILALQQKARARTITDEEREELDRLLAAQRLDGKP